MCSCIRWGSVVGWPLTFRTFRAFLLAGWWLAIGHLSAAVACFVTIVGIPFGIQHIKLALIALAPIGLQVVPVRR